MTVVLSKIIMTRIICQVFNQCIEWILSEWSGNEKAGDTEIVSFSKWNKFFGGGNFDLGWNVSFDHFSCTGFCKLAKKSSVFFAHDSRLKKKIVISFIDNIDVCVFCELLSTGSWLSWCPSGKAQMYKSRRGPVSMET